MTDIYRNLQVVLTANVASFEGAMLHAAKSVDGISTALKDVDKNAAASSASLGKVGASADAASRSGANLKAGLGAAALAVAAGLYESVKAASNFQAEMVKLRTQTGAPIDAGLLKSLSNQVLDLAGQVGFSPTSLAQGLYHLESAGYRGSQALDLLTASAKEAKIGGSDLQDTTQAIIAVTASNIKGISSASQAAGVLNEIVGTGDLRMEQLTKAMATGVVPVAAQAGLSIQSLGAALATITDNASPADEAATRLRMSIALMASPTAAAETALHAINIGANQLAEDMRKPDGIVVAIGDLKAHLDAVGGDGSQQFKALTDAFGGGRSSGSIQTLVDEFDRLKQKMEDLDRGDPAKILADDWAIAQQTTSVEVSQLEASFQALAIRIGTALLPEVGKLAVGVEGLFHNKTLGDYFASIEGPGKDLGKLLQDAAKTLGEFATEVAKVGGGVLGATFKVALEAIDPFAKVLDHVLVVLNKYPEVIDAVAVAYGVKLVASLASATLGTLAMNAAIKVAVLADAGRAAAATSENIASVAVSAAAARGAVGGLTTAAGGLSAALGPVGLALAGVSFAFFEYQKGTAEQKKITDALRQSVIDQSNGVQDATGKTIVAQLAQDNYLRTIKSLALAQPVVNDAVRGNASAQKSLADQIIAGIPALQRNSGMQDLLRGALAGSKREASALEDALAGGSGQTRYYNVQVGQLVVKLADLEQKFKAGKATADQVKQAQEDLANATNATAASDHNLATAADAAAGANSDLAKQVGDVKTALQGFGGTPASVFQKGFTDAQQAAAASTKSSAADQKKAIEDTYKAQHDAAEARKNDISNSSKGSKSAIDQEIAGYKQQENAQLEALKVTQDTSSKGASATQQANQVASYSLQQYITDLDKNNKAIEDWRKNLLIVAQRGGVELAQELAKLGPDSASLVAEAATTKDNGAFQKLKDEVTQQVNDTGDAGAAALTNAFNFMAGAGATGGEGVLTAVLGALGKGPDAIAALVKNWANAMAIGINPLLAAAGQSTIGITTGQFVANALQYGVHPGQVLAHADGGITESHQAEIAAPTYRVWAEPETGGEAYIPLADAKRSSSVPVLAQTADLLGFDLMPRGSTGYFADGGVSGGSNLPVPPKLPDWLMARAAAALMDKTYKSAVSLAASLVSGSGAGAAGPAPAGTVVDWIHAAEKIGGWPDVWTNGLYSLIQHESGGNPHAINLTDSNAAAGHPSKGLMQTIDSTFKAYAFPGHGDIYNPIDNILAGTAYALKNYGAGMIQAGGRHTATGAYMGYDQGGALMPGLTMAYNGTGKPEHVMTEKQIDRIVAAVSHGGGTQIIVQAKQESTEEVSRRVARKLR